MDQVRLFAAAIGAHKPTRLGGQHRYTVTIIKMTGPPTSRKEFLDLARSKAIKTALTEWPREHGWWGHDAKIVEVPPEMIIDAAINIKEREGGK